MWDDTNGTWEYSTNSGFSWTAFGAVSDTEAVLLDELSLVRFVPDTNFSGTAGDIDFRAWDQTSGTTGQTNVDVSTNGLTTAFSTATERATLVVTITNAEPVNAVPGAQSMNENKTLVFSTATLNPISVSDADIGVGDLEVTISVADGTLTLFQTSGLVFSVGTGSGDATMTFTGSVTDINLALDGMQYDPTAAWTGNETLTITTSDQSNEPGANLTTQYAFETDGSDSVGSNDVTLINGAAVVADSERGNVLETDGIDDYANVPAPVTSGLSEFSVSFWVKTTESGSNSNYWERPTLFGTREPSAGSEDFVINTDNGYIGMWSGLSGTNDVYMSTTTQINDGQWHMITISNDGSNASMYVDGAFEALLDTGDGLINQDFTIGALNTGTGVEHFHEGRFDEVRVWDRGLTSVEIINLHPKIDTDTVSITVNPNTPPTANADAYGTDEDTVLNVPALTGLVSNDTDPDTVDTLTVQSVDDSATAGNVTWKRRRELRL